MRLPAGSNRGQAININANSSLAPAAGQEDHAQNPRISGTPHKRHRRTKAELRELDDQLLEVVAEHAPCTVRQVYYRAVVAYLCPKTDAGYNLVQRRLLILRRAGELSYGTISDNLRTHYGRPRYRSLEDFGIAASRYLYAYDYWRDNDRNVQIWAESDSIAGTLTRTVVDKWGLRLHVARGFSSETYLYEAGEDIQDDGRPTFVYVLSDYDPSGVSLAEDIAAKLERFSGDVPVTVERIALSGEQVRLWQLPTHPLKSSDSRAARFQREHTGEACELEAVPPNLLRSLVSKSIEQHIPAEKIEAARRDEELQREALRALPAHFRGAR